MYIRERSYIVICYYWCACGKINACNDRELSPPPSAVCLSGWDVPACHFLAVAVQVRGSREQELCTAVQEEVGEIEWLMLIFHTNIHQLNQSMYQSIQSIVHSRLHICHLPRSSSGQGHGATPNQNTSALCSSNSSHWFTPATATQYLVLHFLSLYCHY